MRSTNHGYHEHSDPKGIPMHPLASRRVPKDTDSERNILPMDAGILRTTDVCITSDFRGTRDDSNETLNASREE